MRYLAIEPSAFSVAIFGSPCDGTDAPVSDSHGQPFRAVRAGTDERPALAVQVQATNTGLRVAVIGELDLMATREIAGSVTRLVELPPPTVDLDLSGVTFIDSQGVNLLLRLRSGIDAAGSSLRVLAASPPVRRVLSITGLTETFGL